jgi:hypothetical protein
MLHPGEIAVTAAAAAAAAMGSSRMALLIMTKRWAMACAALQQHS